MYTSLYTEQGPFCLSEDPPIVFCPGHIGGGYTGGGYTGGGYTGEGYRGGGCTQGNFKLAGISPKLAVKCGFQSLPKKCMYI